MTDPFPSLVVGSLDFYGENFWANFRIYRQHTNMQLPPNYLVVDIETDGTGYQTANILQLGFLQVLNGQVTAHGSVFVQTPEEVLTAYDNGPYVAKRRAEGNDGFVKASDVRAHGLPREDVFRLFKSLVDSTLAIPDAIIVGHNIVQFDVPMLEQFSARATSSPLSFPTHRLFDTGVMYKAHRMGALPALDEPLYEFFVRIANTRVIGLYWRLEEACKAMGVTEKHALDFSRAHDAGSDCLFTHYLYQAIRDKLAA